MRRSSTFFAVSTLLMALLPHQTKADEGLSTRTSEQGLFAVEITEHPEPLPLNQMHSWVVTLMNRQREPINGAQITVRGGMPRHDHGLPTAPRMTRRLGNGGYLLEGVKFHMNGFWQVTLEIRSAEGTDSVTFEFEI